MGIAGFLIPVLIFFQRPLAVQRISLPNFFQRVTFLKYQAVDNARQCAVSLSPQGTVLKRSVANDHMRTDQSFRLVVIFGKPRLIQEREHLIVVLEQPL